MDSRSGSGERGTVASGLHLSRLTCTACGECCRRVRVPLTVADLRRLVAATALPPRELTELCLPEVLVGEPSSVLLVPEGRRVLLLWHRGGGCGFLDVSGRCSVHAARPSACRAYPLHASFSKRAGLTRLRLLRGLDCPYELAERPALELVRRDHLALRQELLAHFDFVRGWNREQERRRRLGKPLRSADALFERALAAPEASPSTL
jgi:Fe-S-cluster containining protein